MALDIKFTVQNTNLTSVNDTSSGKADIQRIVISVVFAILAFFSFVQNLRVISIVLTMPTKKRNGNILVAHLSLVTTLLNYFIAVILLSKLDVWPVDNAFGLCVGHAYIRNAVVSLIPVNVTAIAYEKMKVLQPNYNGEKLLLRRTIAFMWTSVLVGSSPNILTTRYITPDPPNLVGECKVQPIFGSISLTICFETFRLLVYHIFPTLYILYALVLIKAKVSKYLFTAKTQVTSLKMRRKVQKMRYIVLNGVAFIFFWLPSVSLLFYYKIHIRSESAGNSSANHSQPSHFYVMVFLGYLYVMLNPLVHLHLSEDLGEIKWWSMTYSRRSGAKSDTVAYESSGNKAAGSATLGKEISNDENISTCNSRASTFHKSNGSVLQSSSGGGFQNETVQVDKVFV